MELRLQLSDDMQERVETVVTREWVIVEGWRVTPSLFVETHNLLIAHYLAGHGRAVSFRMGRAGYFG